MLFLRTLLVGGIRFASGRKKNPIDFRVQIDERPGVYGMNAFLLELMQDGAHDAVSQALRKVVHPSAITKTPIDTSPKADSIVLRNTVAAPLPRRSNFKARRTGRPVRLPSASGVVIAGWPQPGKMTNYAAKQELGAKGRNVPATKYLRSALYDNEAEIVFIVQRVMARYVRHYTPKEFRKWQKVKRSAPSR